MPKLAERFAAAARRPPLAEMSEWSRRELDAVLETAGSFDDLPGKWQAALLEAEQGAGAGDRPARRPCCGRAPATPAEPPSSEAARPA